jgi:MerR family transcriptional regulator/heat shock protein HspR
MNHDMVDPVISIGTLATKVNLSVSAIRKYEEEGLVISHRTDSGHRMFAYEDIARIQTIQHLIKDLSLNIEGIRRIQALLPCWDFLPCKKKDRNTCPAFKDNTKPCWMIKDAHCSLQGNECRYCIVYRFGSLYTEDIKELLYNQKNDSDRSANIKKLLDQKQNVQKEEK